MDASCKIQRSIHDVRLTYKYVSRILGTYQAYHLKRIFLLLIFFLIKYQFFLLPKRFFTKTTIATIAARRIITNGRIGVLSPVLTAVLAVEFDEPDV